VDGKIQVDPRLRKDEAMELLRDLSLMKRQLKVDPTRVSKALADAYHAVTRLKVLCEAAA
jgi:hypothetical protein